MSKKVDVQIPHVCVPRDLVLDRRLDRSSVNLYLLMTVVGWLSKEKMGVLMGCSSRTVYSALKKLVEAGWIHNNDSRYLLATPLDMEENRATITGNALQRSSLSLIDRDIKEKRGKSSINEYRNIWGEAFKEKTGHDYVWAKRNYPQIAYFAKKYDIELFGKMTRLYFFSQQFWFNNRGTTFSIDNFLKYRGEVLSAVPAESKPEVCPRCGSEQTSNSDTCLSCFLPVDEWEGYGQGMEGQHFDAIQVEEEEKNGNDS